MNEWHYKGGPFPEPTTDLSEWWGFVYLIEDRTTGKKYIGKKFFTKASSKQVNGKRKKIRKTSDWLNYWGSNTTLQEEVKIKGVGAYTRNILHLCRSKAECSYYEAYEIFTRKALISDTYFNEWISCRIRKAHLPKLMNTIK